MEELYSAQTGVFMELLTNIQEFVLGEISAREFLAIHESSYGLYKHLKNLCRDELSFMQRVNRRVIRYDSSIAAEESEKLRLSLEKMLNRFISN
ncbi:hypothetical protein E0K99_03275 [Faecalicoccus pleomorphus]|uniref:hypothetical protein n=1 Tax=Faecalicoccus pleomorphus TaxID=1323 RepID=UPI001430E001|nr:hypothetical protein [Faecalicoccus pleomorphus]NJE40344.1 hypothetical protein [Faecalicoccus pleomorphus]